MLAQSSGCASKNADGAHAISASVPALFFSLSCVFVLARNFQPVLAFHGTADANVRPICETGFRMPGVGGHKHATDTGWYGKGSVEASKKRKRGGQKAEQPRGRADPLDRPSSHNSLLVLLL